jgi:hypothetical protein
MSFGPASDHANVSASEDALESPSLAVAIKRQPHRHPLHQCAEFVRLRGDDSRRFAQTSKG